MKRLASSDSLGTKEIPICPSGFEDKGVYGRGIIQPILEGLDDEECAEEDFWPPGPMATASGSGEKKRRLGLEQVKALEKNFEVENKLEPERKVKLAQDLGLQPRQVAVWFQNRRARWKTKQLERDYSLLKANYDALKLNFDTLHLDKETLLAEIKELRAKLADEERFCSIKEEPVALESENNKNNKMEIAEEEEEQPPALIYKDGSSDSDSSAILNDENSPNHLGISSSSSPAILSHPHPNIHHYHHQQQQQQLMAVGFDQNCPSYSSHLIQSSDGRVKGAWSYKQQQLVRTEEHNFLGGDDPCSSSFFSDEQAPSFSWYCSDQWN